MFPRERYRILKEKLHLTLPPGRHTITIKCELCSEPLTVELEVYRTGNGKTIRGSVVIHHIDGDRDNNDPSNIMLLCDRCHRMLHLLGEIQRWLDKIGKKIEDLPDCRKLKPLIKRYGP